MDPLTFDRRRHRRVPASYPAKIRRRSAARFDAAIAVNISPGGALLRVAGPRPLAVGDQLRVAIAPPPAAPILNADHFRPATVVRAGPAEGSGQDVAVHYDDAPTAALAA